MAESDVPHQVQRFHDALVLTRKQILEVQQRVSHALNAHDASIFDAHLLVLDDPMLIDSVTQLIESKINVDMAFQEFTQKYTATLGAMDDAYLRERVADMRDVTSRVMNNLLGNLQHHALQDLKEPCIIVADDLSPSEVAIIDRKIVLGFATDIGSKTSHAAIVARSLQVPAVVGLKDASVKIKTGAYVLLDGLNGTMIFVNPTDQTLFEYGRLVQQQASIEEKLRSIQSLAATTLDGQTITLSANIEKSGDVAAVKEFGAEGVGLFRTEYLFINRDSLPTEEEQYEAYHAVAAALKPAPVIIRTLDLGGDMFLAHLQIPLEMNPFLGWRAIRFCLEEKEVFPVRSCGRSCAPVPEGNVKIMASDDLESL